MLKTQQVLVLCTPNINFPVIMLSVLCIVDVYVCGSISLHDVLNVNIQQPCGHSLHIILKQWVACASLRIHAKINEDKAVTISKYVCTATWAGKNFRHCVYIYHFQCDMFIVCICLNIYIYIHICAVHVWPFVYLCACHADDVCSCNGWKVTSPNITFLQSF